MAVTIQVRRDTSANWVSHNSVLHQGEPGLETDTGRFKLGDGSTAWTSLGYASQQLTPTTKTGAYTASPGDYVKANISSAGWTLKLPQAPPGNTIVGAKVIANATGNANALTVQCQGGDLFEQSGGSASTTLSLLSQAAAWQYNGGYWTRIADDLPLGQLDGRYLRNGPPPSGDASGATDAANLAAASGAAGSWTTIVLEAGTYYASSTVLTSNVAGVMFRGQGKLNTIIRSVGTGMNGVSVFKFVNCRNSGVEEMWIEGNSTSGQVPLAGVESQANNPTSVPSTNLIVKDCYIGGTSAGSLTYGIAWTLVTDDNNDEGYIENVDVSNVVTSALFIGHRNSLQHKIIGCALGGGGSGITMQGGSFSAHGTSFGCPGWIVDMQSGGTTDTQQYQHSSLLSGVQAEGPTQWFRSNSACTGNPALLVNAFDINGGAANTVCIDWEGPGQFSVSDSYMVTGQTGTTAQFTNASGQAVFTGCTLGIATYSWQNNLAFQSCHHVPGSVTLSPIAGANAVYQPNDTGGGFQPFTFFETYNSSATPTLPAGTYELTCVGGGGGGGGAGEPSSAVLQAGGGGGGAGGTVTSFVTLASSTSVSVTVGAGGAGGGGGATAGANGANGTQGSSSSVTGSGISVLAGGGSPGRLSGGSSTTAGLGGAWGLGVVNGTSYTTPGDGGPGSQAGLAPTGLAAGGGGGGGAATATNGGGGGAAGAYGAADFAAGTSGGSGSAAGATGSSAAANSGGGGGGGGGGGYNSGSEGAGGAGGSGGSGFVIIRRVA